MQGIFHLCDLGLIGATYWETFRDLQNYHYTLIGTVTEKPANSWDEHLENNFDLFTLRDQLVVANCRQRVYFEQQILALLFLCQTHNLSRIKFAPFRGGLRVCISSEAVSMKPSLSPDRKTTGATIGYNVITCSQ